MDWTTRMNRALDFIEANLDNDIDLKQAARLALCSLNDFSNMFFIATGIHLSEYIRRRRLSLAALELQSSHAKIIDISLKYGYSSPTAFNRAFKNQHNFSPQYARTRKISLVTYPRLSLQIKVKGDTEVKIRIEQKPAFAIIGIRKRFRNDMEGDHHIPAFWQETKVETYDTIRSLANIEPKKFMGLCADFDGEHEFDYYIAVATTKDTPEGFHKYTVPAATWAILEKDGDLQGLSQRFWKEWLPSSGYKRAEESIPEIEVYPDDNMTEDNFNYELWFPIVKS